ncbi:MAG: ribonuclease Z [Euryarchaeota archaeon RBG_16_68_12]|nr:MAG: ribonuclease Z [Euryarchaeota archaeon RBG_16_68_12]
MQIVFLGTSGSWPTPKRNVSAIAVKRGPEVLLFDCGEGTQRQFMLSKLSFMQTSRIFLTHFHGDHFLGVPGLVQSMSMNGREKELLVYGPAGTEDLVETLVTLGHFGAGFPVRARSLRGGDSVDCGEYAVRAVESAHTVPAIGYVLEEGARPGRFSLEKAQALGVPAGPLYGRLQEGQAVTVGGRTVTPDMVLGPPRRGRKVVYTGDTLPAAGILKAALDCDVLIHDATADSPLEEKANRYGHSTGRQAAEIARKAGARALILTHYSPRYEDATPILEEAKAVFPNTYMAEDFFEYEVPNPD